MVGIACLALLGAACGTRVDKSAYLRQVQYGSGAGSQGNASPGGSAVPGDQSSSGSGASGSGSGQASGGSGSAGPSGSAGGPGGAKASPVGTTASGKPGAGSANPYNLSTAQLGNTITLGIHVPETGAAPLPMGWQQDISTLVSWMNANPVNGRKISVNVQDDAYDPSTGAAACNKILDAHPLLVIGWTMPEVELDCASLFSQHRIPYITRGAAPNILSGCSVPICYFATMADDLQGKLAADYVIDDLNGRSSKIGMVWENDQPASPKAFVAEVQSKGGKVAVNESSVPRQSDFTSTIVKLQQAGCQVVMLSMAPVDAITLTTQAQSQGYHPTWLGLGTYWNYNMSLQSAGMAMDGAISFSPWASIDSAAAGQWRSIDAQFNPGSQPDDVGLVLYGVFDLMRTALEKAGPNLSAFSLVGALNSLQFSAPFWAPITYTSSNHSGPVSIAVFRADGQAKRWDQITGFTSGF